MNVCLTHLILSGSNNAAKWKYGNVSICQCMHLTGNLYCKANITIDYSKGRDVTVEINWPATIVGSRRIVHCPYAYDQPSYAHRDCVLSSTDQRPIWSEANVLSCPDPPFTQGVDTLASFVVSIHRLSLFWNVYFTFSVLAVRLKYDVCVDLRRPRRVCRGGPDTFSHEPETRLRRWAFHPIRDRDILFSETLAETFVIFHQRCSDIGETINIEIHTILRFTCTTYLYNGYLPWYIVVLTLRVHSSVKYSQQSQLWTRATVE